MSPTMEEQLQSLSQKVATGDFLRTCQPSPPTHTHSLMKGSAGPWQSCLSSREGDTLKLQQCGAKRTHWWVF